MAMRQTKPRSDCRISFALDIFGDKWTLLILRDLIMRHKSSYGDFLESEEKIATNILADRLRMLEQTGIVKKSVDSNNKTKYKYSLTRKGLDLLPVLVEIMLWSAKYAPKLDAKKYPLKKKLEQRVLQDKFALMRDIVKDIEKSQLGLG
jgi:DNA-binding HxlR family transcriptional regulator